MVALGTALEIVGNRTDIVIALDPPDGPPNSPCGIFISRGPGHGYKPLLTQESHQFLSCREAALEGIERTFYIILIGATMPPKDIWEPFAQLTDQSEQLQWLRRLAKTRGPVNERCLNLDQVDLIMQELRRTGACLTANIL